MTSDEWEEALVKEANEKSERERLISEYKEWLEKEKVERKVEDDKRMKEWTAYKDEYLKNNPRRKRCDRNKPTILKRPDTPEQFWSIRPKRAWVAERVEDLVVRDIGIANHVVIHRRIGRKKLSRAIRADLVRDFRAIDLFLPRVGQRFVHVSRDHQRVGRRPRRRLVFQQRELDWQLTGMLVDEAIHAARVRLE